MPELPDARKERFQKAYQIPAYDAEVLTSEKYLADFFETCITYDVDAKKVSNWLMSDFLRFINELDLEFSEILLTPEDLATMIRLIDQEVISGKIGKTVLREMLATGKTPQTIIEELGLTDVHFQYTGGKRGWKGDVPRFQFDITKMNNLGWKPIYSSDEAVRKATRDLLDSGV